MKKILFISHDAFRAGAPILLLNLAKLILKNEPNSITFLLKKGGSLEKDFKLVAPTFFVHEQIKSNRFSRFFKKKRKGIIDDSDFLNQFEYIISNTITNGDIIQNIRNNFKGKIISYIHELEIATKAYSNPTDVSNLIKYSDVFWVPSSIVNDFLVNKFNILQDKVFTIPYYIPYGATDLNLKKNIKEEFVIGGCGTVDWRKGADLFIVVARQTFIKFPKARIIFRWAGVIHGIELERLNYELQKCNLEDKVFFEFASSDLNYFYNSIDLFLLTSREDPYPLVILEAAKFNVPSICFDLVCGSKDFILNSNGGTIVPFLDIDVTVQTIISYYNDLDYRNKLGRNAYNYLKKTHSNDEFVYNKFKDLLEKLI